MNWARMIASIVLASLALTITLTLLEPPLGVILGVIICGLLAGIIQDKILPSMLSGALSGLLGFTLAYIIGGGGPLGLAVYMELLGPIGPLVAPTYYMVTCSITAILTTTLLPYLRIRA